MRLVHKLMKRDVMLVWPRERFEHLGEKKKKSEKKEKQTAILGANVANFSLPKISAIKPGVCSSYECSAD